MGLFSSKSPACPSCRGGMIKKTQSSGNFTGLIGAIVVLMLGIAVTIFIPVIGWVVGPLMVLCSLGMGGKRTKVWRCASCKVAIPRG